MKIICSKSQLLSGVNIVSRAVSTKSTMEILSCILIEADSSSIKMTANDNEMGIETIIDGEILEKGQIALEARIFSEIIKKLPDSEVIIRTQENGNTNIKCGHMECDIMGRKGDDFSHLPLVEKENKIVISHFDLKEVVRQTIFSISTNENNRLMTGELLRVKGNRMTVISLDGHRISIRTLALADNYDPTEIIVPGKTLSEITKILPGEAEDMLSIYITDRHILFEFDRTRMVSRLLEGKFYNISQMLSTDYETKITINKMSMIHCLDRSTLFIKESDKKPIIFDIRPDEMGMRISSDVGSMKDQLDIKKEGKDLTIGFNPRFLVDALRVIDEEEVDIYFINEVAPCMIRAKDDSYLYIILPIAIPRY